MVYKKVCKICGKEFETNCSRIKCCSAVCTKKNAKKVSRDYYEKNAKWEPTFHQRVCPVCGEHFTTTKKTKTYCSKSCKDKNRYKILSKNKKQAKCLSNTKNFGTMDRWEYELKLKIEKKISDEEAKRIYSQMRREYMKSVHL